MDFQDALSALPQRRAWTVETHEDGDLLTALLWFLCWPSGATAPRAEMAATVYRNEAPDQELPDVISGPWWTPCHSFRDEEHAAEVPRSIQGRDWTPTEAIRDEFVHSDLDTVGERIMLLRGETVEVASFGGCAPPFERATVEHHGG